VRVLMLVATSVVSDTRVLREAATLAAAGHRVHVVGRSVPAGFGPPPGVTVSSAGPAARRSNHAAGRPRRPASWRAARWLLLPEHRALAVARWARDAAADAATRTFDVVHAHDFNALPTGRRLARERGVPLVYDSHELWFGRPVVGRPTPLRTWRGRRAERRLGRDASVVVTVGDGVAEALEQQYGWTDVRVVRNSFPLLPPAVEQPTPRRLVYAGRLAPYRELEVIAEAAARLPLPVDLVGPADDTWLAGFDAGAARIRPALPPGEVGPLLRSAGVALVTHSDQWPNHRLAMPNKLFQAVAAGVPVVATNVGELAVVVRGYRLGSLYEPGDADSLVRAVEDVLAGYEHHLAAVRAAARALSWAADEQVLLDVYAGLPPATSGVPESLSEKGRSAT